MCNLGLRVYEAFDALEQALLGELDSLLDSVDESPCDEEISTVISSSVAGGVSAGQGCLILILGEGLMVDKFPSNSSCVGAALVVGVVLGGWVGLGMQLGECKVGAELDFLSGKCILNVCLV